MTDEHTLDEIIELLSSNRHVDTVRVVAKMDSEWFFYNRDSLTHYLTAQFLKRDERLANAFYAVGKNTTSWVSNNSQKCWFGGTFAFDIQLKERVPQQLFEKYISEINEGLKSCKILRVFGDTKTLSVKRESDVSYLGQTSVYSMSQIKDKMSNFNWDIKVAVKSMGGQLDFETRSMPELKNRILFVQNGTVLIYASLPAHINPYMVMASITGKGYEKMLADFQFNILDQGIETDATCKCGRHLTYSQFTGSNERVCQVCKGKLVLAKMTGKK